MAIFSLGLAAEEAPDVVYIVEPPLVGLRLLQEPRRSCETASSDVLHLQEKVYAADPKRGASVRVRLRAAGFATMELLGQACLPPALSDLDARSEASWALGWRPASNLSTSLFEREWPGDDRSQRGR